MEGDEVFTPERALELHGRWWRRGLLPMWVVFANPRDYPGKVVARPSVIGRVPGSDDNLHAAGGVLVADTLKDLRAMLPPGLTRLPRDPGDVPAIVESWL